jgi:hypothetical protein
MGVEEGGRSRDITNCRKSRGSGYLVQPMESQKGLNCYEAPGSGNLWGQAD